MDSVLLVINKFTKDIVVLTPANITAIVAISCDPKPVNLVFEEKGVIKVQPAIVKEELLHCTTNVLLFFKNVLSLKKKYHTVSFILLLNIL